jgi:hypothetical protein
MWGRTAALFDSLKVSHKSSYRVHLNQYDVIKINIQVFLSKHRNINELLSVLQERVITELRLAYSCVAKGEIQLDWAMDSIFTAIHLR